MRVLVACEFSGIVRDAFMARGHDAISVDLLPTERPGPHAIGKVEPILDAINLGLIDFDLMIAHPPCTYLANSGVRWLYGGKGTVRDPERWAQMEKAARFFRDLLEAPIPRIAIENPIMHGWGKQLIGQEPAQTIQPYWFGHGETKATCLVNSRQPRVHHASPGPDRWKERSRTLQGIADAMAAQWGSS